MKPIITVFIFMFFASCHTQQKREAALYNLPTFQMLLTDSVSLLNTENIPTGKPIIFLFFRPDCTHCQKETQAILDNMDSFKDTHIYMLTNAAIPEIRIFSQNFKLNNYKNFTIGRDYNHSFFRLFRPSSVPFIAIYDGQKQLLKIYSDEVGISDIMNAIQI